jgi:hypothetical protein
MSAYAQTTTYPLQVNANVVPPYSLYLSDYYSGTRDRLSITLINRDQLTPTVNVRLRMIITAAGGIRIQTNENAFIQPLVVEAGSPVRLTQEDLTPYFQPDNIITQGFLSAGKMPEGMVEFCFQAIEAYTGRVLSTSTCTRAWITSQKPPLLSLPRNDESIAFREPLNVLFQWTPLHQGLAQVEYDFILKELWDNGMTPQAAFPYSPEIYRETTRSTSIVYGALQPPLLPGKRYAWCVQAKARDGMEELNVFQNNGYSEIRWFKLQDNCQPLELVEATAERKRVTLAWTPLPEHIGFTINYREKSSGDQQNEWKEQSTQQPQSTLYGLKAGAIYEYRVGSICMSGQPIYTPIMEVLVPAADSARTAQCGIMPAINLQNQELIGELKPREVFQVGDFPVTVVRCSGGKGSLTGVGWTVIPWLNDAKMAVEFNNISVNTDKQMTAGIVKAIYDEKAGQIANLDNAFEGGNDQGLVKTGLTKTDTTFDFSIPGAESFQLGDDGSLIITDAAGEPHSIAMSDREGEGNEGNSVKVFPMTVKDKDGNVYQVEKVTETKDGQEKEVVKATKLGNIGTALADGSFDPTQLNGDKAIVRFNKGTGKYSFDTWQDYYSSILLIRDKYERLYNDYYAAWKLLPDGQSDDVAATIEIVDKTIDPTKVIFTTPKGTRYDAVYKDGKYTLRVVAGPEGDVQELYALYPKGGDKYYTLGKLGIATYAAQSYKVFLVPVNDAPVDVDAIRAKLRATYGPVAVTWEVEKLENYMYLSETQLMQESTSLSTYNSYMQNLNRVYTMDQSEDFDRKANYLFFLKATGYKDINDRDATGFMPRGAQFGYVFTSEIRKKLVPQIVAHELGHGRWKLFHTFDKNYGGFDAARFTENLMSYDTASHIAKWQWDQIASPALLVSIFEKDQSSEYTDKAYVQKVLQQIRCAYINGETIYQGLDKKGVFLGISDRLGTIRITIVDKPIALKRGEPKAQRTGGMQSKLMQTVDYGGLQLSYYGERAGFDKVQDYLFPASATVHMADAKATLDALRGKSSWTDAEIESIREVANCGAQYFSVKDKVDIISYLATTKIPLTESYEDLILDLIENFSGDYKTYAQTFLDLLSTRHEAMQRLFYGMDNKTVVWGHENNEDRFVQVIFELWGATTHKEKSKYQYLEVDEIIGTNRYSPYCLPYQGSTLFPSMKYSDAMFINGKMEFPFTILVNGADKRSRFVYDYFQPIFLVKEFQGNVTYLSADIPAIMFASIISKDNFDRVAKQASLTADIVLTFSGVGNATKLRHLKKAQQVGKIILAGLEFGTSALDLILNYTDFCTEPELCEKLKEYNFYIQIGMMSGEAISMLYKNGLAQAKQAAKAAYEDGRPALVKKYGADSDKVKLMDEHFGFADPDKLIVIREVGERAFKHIKHGEVKITIVNPQLPKNDLNFIIESYSYQGGDLGREVQKGYTAKADISGYHTFNASGNIKVTNKQQIGTLPSGEPIYKAEVEMFVKELEKSTKSKGWIAKEKPSTFWPETWSDDKIKDTIMEAFKGIQSIKGNYWEGITSNGTKVGGYIDEAGTEMLSAWIIF